MEIMAVMRYLMRYMFLISIVCYVIFSRRVFVQGSEQNCKFVLERNGSSSESYDLSSLSRPWKMKIDSRRDAFISLCGSTKNLCGSDGVCIQENNGNVSTQLNMGRTVQRASNHESKNKKRLTIWLTDGDTCNSHMNYSTEINFFCHTQFAEPDYVSFDNETCQLVVNWGTSAACPIEPALQDSCKPSGTSSFNLWPLRHKQYYTVKTEKEEFRINICDAVQDGICNKNNSGSVCSMIPGTDKIQEVLGISGKQHLESTEKGLVLTYKSDSKKLKTEIIFICNSNILHGEPKFKSSSSKIYTFEFETSLACISTPIDCTAYDRQGSKYDLQSLGKLKGNWVVPDHRPGYENIKYYINVCRPLNPVLGFNCSEAFSAVCQTATDKNGLSSVNLGVLGTGPLVDQQNQLKLNYKGGSPCHTGMFRRRTEITFRCSKTEREPKFIHESPDCVFSFEWFTPAACPTKYAVGEDCVVMEPGFDRSFNLNPLYNPHMDYFMSTESGSSFSLNLCKPLSRSCNGKKDVGVCLERNGTQYAIGEVATKPIYQDGRLNFLLQGEGCKPGHNSSTVYIIFLCHQGYVNDIPELFSEAEDCTFYFLWQSNASCQPYEEYACRAVDDQGHEFDLSPLSNPSNNHIVQNKTSGGYVIFLLNVCRSIVHGHEAPCPPLAGVCFYNLTEPDRTKNYISLGDVVSLGESGTVPNLLKFENGQLQITYTGGHICPGDGPPDFSSTIHFYCDRNNKDSRPKFRGNTACHYEFEWGTSYACVSEMQNTQEIQQRNCTALDPIANRLFDLTALWKKDYSITTDTGKTFSLAACGSSEKCGEGIGACLEVNGSMKSIGLANSNLEFDSPGLLVLRYGNGSECTHGIKYDTLIEFLCEEDPSKFGPVFVDSISNCSFIFSWLTNLVCEMKSPCMANNGTMEISLSPLASSTKNYKVSANGSDFFINVCRPLVPQKGLSCRGGSSACKAQPETGSGLWVHEQSLGYSKSDPVIVGGGIFLKYLSGSPCPGKNYDLSSSFLFGCDPTAGVGTPELQNFTKDCEYQFLWKTDVLCPDYVTKINASSHILNNNQCHKSFDLSPLCDNHGYSVEGYVVECSKNVLSVSHHGRNRLISHGSAKDVVFSYSENVTKLLFSGGDLCFSDGQERMSFNAEIKLRCVPEGEIGNPAILYATNCSVILDWGNRVGCGQDASAFLVDNHPTSSMSQSQVSIAGVVIGILLIITICALLLYLRKPANRTWCRNRFCSLFSKRHHGNFHYSREDWDDT